MEQLVAIVIAIVVGCGAGMWLERRGHVARVVGHVLLIGAGCATGFLLSLLLELVLWPGAIGVILGGAYTPLSAEQDRRAGLVFAAIVGGAGALLPSAAFRFGYAAGALFLIQGGSEYWFSHGSGLLALVALACWAIVALSVRALRWWLRPDPCAGQEATPV